MSTSRELLTTSLEQAAHDYETLGICLVADGAPLELMQEWENTLRYGCNKFIRNDAMGSMEEAGDYLILDGPNTRATLKGVGEIYTKFRDWSSLIIREQAMYSPYPLSEMNAKVYPDTWGKQGLHYDSQPFTCLLYVNEGAPTQIKLLTGEWVDIDPIPGAVAFFHGREMEHRVLTGTPGSFRVTVPFNYYLEDDYERPSWIDEAIYMNKDYVSA